MSKKLLEEGTIRQFMKLANLQPLSENFLDEGKDDKKEDDPTKPAKIEALEKGAVTKASEKADKQARKKLTKESEELEEGADVEEYGDMGEMGHGDEVNEEVLDEDLDALLEDELSEMGMDYEADDDMEMEAEAGDMEAEINITPDQARAIIAVADMLKDIMPDLDAPEMEDEEEMDMDMDADADMAAADDEADADAEMADAAADEADEEEELAETVMRRVKARLKEMKSK